MKIEKWNRKVIRIREDRYVCATDMAKAETIPDLDDNGVQKKDKNGKLKWKKPRIDKFLELDSTKAYLKTLSEKLNIPVNKDDKLPSHGVVYHDSNNCHYLIEVQEGRNGGTFFHPKLALRFAQWCSPEFAVEVDFWLDDVLQGKKTLPIGIDPSRHQLYRPIEQGKLSWRKTFPDYFYEALFRLDDRAVDLKAKPPCMAKYTIKYIYDQLERTAPKTIYKELILLREEHEKQGLKGLGFLHQYLSDEGRKLLYRTIDHITFLINLAVEYSPVIGQRKHKLEEWLKQRSGQYVLPFSENSFTYSVINKMRESA